MFFFVENVIFTLGKPSRRHERLGEQDVGKEPEIDHEECVKKEKHVFICSRATPLLFTVYAK